MNKVINLLTAVVAVIMMNACKGIRTQSEEKAVLTREVVVDTVFTNQFLPRGDGFTGGDGVYSVLLPDGRTVWIFGDSFIGNVTSDNRRIKTTPAYIRNSFVVIEEGQLITFQQGKPSEFKSMMIPPEVAEGNLGYDEHRLWYWPGDGFVENGNLNVFVSKFSQENLDDMWGFNFEGTELLTFSLPDFELLRVDRFNNLDSIHFGHAVLKTDAYTYVYGLKNQKPYAARTTKVTDRDLWEFYNGNDWVDTAEEAKPMLNFSGSEQFSVFEWKGSFVMIMQEGDLSNKIYSFTAETPYGPWSNQQLLYETPKLENCETCWSYNALAHPQFEEDDMLLISYNTNSMEMEDHYKNALIYRPRFIRVPMEMILSQN
ncbi:MAG: DUF5005 domain-containing protein [Cyclobacteriaceae bacterium]|nr:DUF5005 domain-containing protein [Cyclobacteriaceae bacterium]